MANFSFYHISTTSFEKAICTLIEKCYKTGLKTFVKFKDKDLMNRINDYLWVFSQSSFVPHSTIYEEKTDIQPVLLSDSDELLNSPENLVLIGCDHKYAANFSRILVIFNDEDSELKNFSRSLYSKYKNENNDLLYYKQDLKGDWHCLNNAE